MIARALRRTLLSWLAVFAIMFAVVAAVGRPLLAVFYYTAQHRFAMALKQRWLANPRNAAALAADLRQFAREQRWDHPEKTHTDADFFCPGDARLPDTIKRFAPSWIQISDDRIDISCGEVGREISDSYGLSIWRDPNVAGYGTKKLGDGMWYFEQTYRTHDFGSND